MEEIDPLTGEVIREIQNTDLNGTQGTPAFYSENPIPSVLVPSNKLAFGMYAFHLNVSMAGEIEIEDLDTVYIEIGKLSYFWFLGVFSKYAYSV